MFKKATKMFLFSAARGDLLTGLSVVLEMTYLIGVTNKLPSLSNWGFGESFKTMWTSVYLKVSLFISKHENSQIFRF